VLAFHLREALGDDPGGQTNQSLVSFMKILTLRSRRLSHTSFYSWGQQKWAQMSSLGEGQAHSGGVHAVTPFMMTRKLTNEIMLNKLAIWSNFEERVLSMSLGYFSEDKC
jgi:hypothetical protein